MRIGHGFDSHRLVENRKLILGGAEIPYDRGLLGHSDADVLTHAVMDALAGAAGIDDIGLLFPDTNPEYKDADSVKLLSIIRDMLKERGYSIVNIDCTVIAQAPKLSPYREEISANIAAALDILPLFVNVKFTTEEGMGYSGRGEGMAAHAVVLID